MKSKIIKKTLKNERCDFSILPIKPIENYGFSRFGVSKIHPKMIEKQVRKMIGKKMPKNMKFDPKLIPKGSQNPPKSRNNASKKRCGKLLKKQKLSVQFFRPFSTQPGLPNTQWSKMQIPAEGQQRKAK